MLHLENHVWYVNFSKGLLMLGPSCEGMLQLKMLSQFLLLSSQNQLLQIVIWKQFLID